MKEVLEIKKFKFLIKLFDGYSLLTENLLNQNKSLQSTFIEFENFYHQYEKLNEKYSEMKKIIDSKDIEILKLKLKNENIIENGKEILSNHSGNNSNTERERVMFDDEKHIFNKKIKSKKIKLFRNKSTKRG